MALIIVVTFLYLLATEEVKKFFYRRLERS